MSSEKQLVPLDIHMDYIIYEPYHFRKAMMHMEVRNRVSDEYDQISMYEEAVYTIVLNPVHN
jgi:hypothetical protein